MVVYYILQNSSDSRNSGSGTEGATLPGHLVTVQIFIAFTCKDQNGDTLSSLTAMQHAERLYNYCVNTPFFLMQQYQQQYQWLSDAVIIMSLPFHARRKRLICLCIVFHTENRSSCKVAA